MQEYTKSQYVEFDKSTLKRKLMQSFQKQRLT